MRSHLMMIKLIKKKKIKINNLIHTNIKKKPMFHQIIKIQNNLNLFNRLNNQIQMEIILQTMIHKNKNIIKT